MLYNEPCKTGQLQVTATTVKVVSFKRVVWSTPRNSITYIALKRSVVMTELTIFTAYNHYPASLGNQLAEKFLALFPGVPRGAPLSVQPQAFTPPVMQEPQWSVPLSSPFQSPLTKKKIPVWAYVVATIVLLSFFGCIGSAMFNAVSGNTNQAQVATPTTQTNTLSIPPTDSVPTVQPTPTMPPTPKPTPKPTSRPVPTHAPATPTPCPGINCNPWGYNFSLGTLIYTPPSSFCSYFNCIASFYSSDDPGDGFIIQCQDGTYSQSGGERGACSSHGGEARPLYAH